MRKRISIAPIYCTRWECRMLYNDTNNTCMHMCACTHTYAHTYAHTYKHKMMEIVVSILWSFFFSSWTGVDPKSVLCAFFKQGACTKGDKCKFSHDLAIERKAEKRSLYDDGKGGGKLALVSALWDCLSVCVWVRLEEGKTCRTRIGVWTCQHLVFVCLMKGEGWIPWTPFLFRCSVLAWLLF